MMYGMNGDAATCVKCTSQKEHDHPKVYAGANTVVISPATWTRPLERVYILYVTRDRSGDFPGVITRWRDGKWTPQGESDERMSE